MAEELKSAATAASIPEKLEGDQFTKDDAVAGLESSRQALKEVLRGSFRTDGRIKGFKPGAGSFLAYLLAHDAHHRGQISMLARQLGHPISKSAMFGLWEWGIRQSSAIRDCLQTVFPHAISGSFDN